MTGCWKLIPFRDMAVNTIPIVFLGVATRWELVPQSRLLALLVNPNNAESGAMIRDLREAARAKRVELHTSWRLGPKARSTPRSKPWSN
jgi:hypothetical protein